MSVLVLNNINKSYKKTKVIDNFSMVLDYGEIVSIIGPSGSGKTTLLRCINGLEKIDSGNILINSKKITSKPLKQEVLDVGLVFQDYELFPQYSAINNIMLPLTKVLKINKEEAKIRAIELLKKMQISKKCNSYPYELSGGEKQRLAIARTLATNPQIICFDEPTSALDPSLVKSLSQIIKELANENRAILIVTHDISFANKVSNRIIDFKKFDKIVE